MLKRDRFKHKVRKKPFSAIRYDKRTLSVFLEPGYLTISTVNGRKRFDFVLPPERQVESEAPPLVVGDRRLGIDLGINNIAVCSDNSFYNSKHRKNVKGKYRHLKAELQSKGARSAKRKLQEVSGRERRFIRDSNHCVAKEIANKPYDVFVFEDLKGIRDQKKSREFNRKLGSWSNHELLHFVEYKAEALGKRVEVIDPKYTSQTCSRCGHVSSNNRTGRQFTCVRCGFTPDADLNASRNIAAFSTREGGRLRVSEPNAAGGEAEGREAGEAELSCKPVSLLVGS